MPIFYNQRKFYSNEELVLKAKGNCTGRSQIHLLGNKQRTFKDTLAHYLDMSLTKLIIHRIVGKTVFRVNLTITFCPNLLPLLHRNFPRCLHHTHTHRFWNVNFPDNNLHSRKHVFEHHPESGGELKILFFFPPPSGKRNYSNKQLIW